MFLLRLSIICLLATLQNGASGEDILENVEGILEVGVAIIIFGKTLPSGEVFWINLQEGKGYEDGNITLHMKIFYKENLLILNTWENGKWMEEERYQDVPEGYGDSKNKFEIRIEQMEDFFDIDINGKRQYTFTYRTDKNKINYLAIHGDIKIHDIDAAIKVGENKYVPY